MPDIIHRIGMHATSEKVYAALSSIDGLAAWWTEETSGSAAVGGKIEFTFRSDADVKGKMIMKVIESNPGKNVKWTCLEGPEEWIQTDISFDLAEQDDQTIIIFGHRRWREPVEFMAHCSMKWAVFLLSLKEYLETGRGRPSPGDLKIDNWN